jgi:hypothetical protein
VVGHEDIGVKPPQEPRYTLTQKQTKGRSIGIVTNDVLLFVATTGDMPKGTRMVESQGSCHARNVVCVCREGSRLEQFRLFPGNITAD